MVDNSLKNLEDAIVRCDRLDSKSPGGKTTFKNKIFRSGNDAGRNILHLAALFGADAVIEKLIDTYKDLGIDVDIPDGFNYTAAELACIYQKDGSHLFKPNGITTPSSANITIFNQKTEHGIEKDTQKDRDRRRILEKLTKSGSKWASKPYSKAYNPLHWAIMNGDSKLAEYVLVTNSKFSKVL